MDNLNLDSDDIDEMDNFEASTDLEVISDDTPEGDVDYHDKFKEITRACQIHKHINCSKLSISIQSKNMSSDARLNYILT
ncbi:hypothetical protein ACJMK2_018836 [Sinanodonta woodiana]|uniref:Uncharacterized protein n=1 Tax=Sinanodonta woodiana TaxID=1069815 RepID=A0ABD3UG21_SINWO